jgi:ubiquinone/menaquinone biosynthesis C-methylase UbiE
MPSADAEPLERGLARVRPPVETVLEVGGGSGRAAAAIDADPVILDASRGMLARARARGLQGVLADAGRLPVGDGRADAVLIVDALHHFPEPRTALAEAVRVLRPGGALVVRDFDPTTLRGRLVSVGERALGWPATLLQPDRLQALLDDLGLEATVQDRGLTYTVVGLKSTNSDEVAT